MKPPAWWQRHAAWSRRYAGLTYLLLSAAFALFALTNRDPGQRNMNVVFSVLWLGHGVREVYKAKRGGSS